MKENEQILPLAIKPVIFNDRFIVRQDAEWPVPGFYIISGQAHVGSIADTSPQWGREFGELLYHVRTGMREVLGVSRAQIYHEEKIISPHFHTWILPIWHDVAEANGCFPKIYEANIRRYLDLFTFTAEIQQTILSYNDRLAQFLLGITSLHEYGFRTKSCPL